ncbi:MAG TPA: hypothetical protein VD903_05810 [Pseudonocardia sp.]|nr:hypothetical protein [Pseudonocardia sp.]
MNATAATLSNRDRAVLRAVADGRCELAGAVLVVDGLCFCDQFAGLRLAAAGLIDAQPGPAHLTSSGRALLPAA